MAELRVACIAAVRFLAAIGIADFPIYGLATGGRFGVVFQAWYSTARKVIVSTMNISDFGLY